MANICRICKSINAIILFNVPKDAKKRKLWSEATEVQLTQADVLCEKHFKPTDFIGGIIKKNCRLKANATPLPKEKDVASKSKDETPKVKPIIEPLTVKVEVDPLNYINEEKFDEQLKTVEADQAVEPQNGTLAVAKHLDMGRIVFSLESENFTIQCKYCELKFEFPEWQSFPKHVQDTHASVIDAQRSKQEKEKDSAEPKISLKSSENENNFVKQETEETELELDNAAEQQEHTDDSFDADEDYEPEAKKEKRTKEKRKSNNKNDECGNLIIFDTQPRAYVLAFLELLKSNAILWHRRQSIMKRFDETLSTALITFNDNHSDYQLTAESARMSINRIKDLYQRITDPKHKRHIKGSAHKTKFPEFFVHCQEIEENSKKLVFNCSNCRAFFYTALDLQIHKAKSHKIGELPFKCPHCGYGFAKAELLEAHEAKHKRSRDFVCDSCNRGFYSEQLLRAHAYTHSDDVKPVCEICGQKFFNYNTYRRHKLRHGEPKEKCEMCGKLFYEKWNLSEHIKSHLNERSYNCDICGKSFNHQNDVTIHKRGVHNMKPTKRRAIWVSKTDLEKLTQSQQQAKDDNEEEEESSEAENFYSDNLHDFNITM